MLQNFRDLQYAFQRPSRGSAGFTIIEVMIVLVIAAVILLIVFLAVPALQRNSRNTQRKHDLSLIAAQFGEYVQNNGGKFPLNAEFRDNFVPTLQNEMGIYKAEFNVNDGLSYANLVTNPGANTTTPTVSRVHVRVGLKCDADTYANTGSWPTGSANQFIVVGWLEAGSGYSTTPTCIES